MTQCALSGGMHRDVSFLLNKSQLLDAILKRISNTQRVVLGRYCYSDTFFRNCRVCLSAWMLMLCIQLCNQTRLMVTEVSLLVRSKRANYSCWAKSAGNLAPWLNRKKSLNFEKGVTAVITSTGLSTRD